MARKTGRDRTILMSDEHRLKIANSNILNALVEHVEGRREMSASQVAAGLGLLKKVLPDLTHATLAGDPNNPIRIAQEMTDEELLALATRGSTGVAEAPARPAKPH